MHTFVWAVAVIGALIGAVDLVLGVRLQESAPQQAVVAAMSVGWAVIPYVVARAYDELTGHGPARPRIGDAKTPAKRP